MFQMSLFPQPSAVQQTMCEHVDTRIHAAIQMGSGGSNMRDVFQKNPDMSQKQFYYMLREQSGADTAKEKQQLWKRVAAFYETLPQAYGTKSDQTGKRYYEEMSDEKKSYLKSLFYKQMKASVGMRALYEIMLADVNKPADAPTFRELRAWHSAQRVNQLSRPANAQSKSLATVVNRSVLIPGRKFGCDSIVMQGSGADDRKMLDQGFAGIVNYIDYATRRSFPYPVRKVGDPKEAARKFVEMCKFIRNDYYNDSESDRWPSAKCTIIHDNGPEFAKSWRDSVEEELGDDVDVTFQPAQANNPNTNPVVENSNKQIRNVLRRIAQANRTTNQNDGKKKPWQSYWVGPQQIYFKQMIKAVNSRPDVSLGRTSPLVVWDAYRDNDNDIVQQTQGAQIRDADKRRGPSRIQPHAFFRKGQTVRRISTHYTKDGIRSNMSKQGNRWSLSTYTIHTVQKFNNAPPQYKLTLHSGKKPSDFKTDADGVSTVWYSHDQLQLNWADVDAPQALMENTVLAPAGLAVGDRVAVAWVRVRETGASVDTWTIVYANLPQRLASGQLEAIRDDETWHEGDVVAKNVAQNWVRIKFDDGTVARLSFQPTNNSYVEAGKYDKM